MIVRLNQIFSQHNYKIGVVYPIFYRIIETISNDIYYIQEPEIFNCDLRGYDVIWLQNPNLFSGNTHDRDRLKKLIKNNTATLFVVDEAGMLTLIEWEKYSLMTYCKEIDNLIILSTFSKIYGMSGLRAGFATGNAKVLKMIEKYSLTFPLSAVTEFFLDNILGKENEVGYFRKKISSNKDNLEKLMERDRDVFLKHNLTNCIFAYHKSKNLSEELLRRGIITLELDRVLGVEEKRYVRIAVHSSNRTYNLLRDAIFEVLSLKD